MHFPILRWGEPYQSLDVDRVVHFATGEHLADVSQSNAGLIARDIKKAANAREALRAIPITDLCARLQRAADLFLRSTLTLPGGTQSPTDFTRFQSATTGLPERLCRLNMEKLHYVLSNLERILRSLMRGLDASILTRGYGEDGGVMRSMQANTPVLGLVLPSNSPGTHGLWLPVPALQVGLVLKPGPLEPWTPYRMAAAFAEAGIPREAMSIYPGGAEAGAAVIEHVPVKMIFGGLSTVQQYRGNPSVQVHGPGFSKILIGDDCADEWERYLDVMVDSVFVNSGRGCINCSGIWTPRNGRAIAEAIAARIGPIAPLPPQDEKSSLAAFTVPAQAEAINGQIEAGLREDGMVDVAAAHRCGDRLVRMERCAYLRPTVVYCPSPDRALANTEYMFPFVSVIECPQDQMLDRIGGTLVATVLSNDAAFRQRSISCTRIDRLNLGPIPTTALNWLQPHEGNIVSFLFRERAVQVA